MTATEASVRTSPASDGFIASDPDNISLFPDQITDNLMHVVIALGAERRHMSMLEAVPEKTGLSTSDVEPHRPTPEQTAEWAQERDLVFGRAFDALSRTGIANDNQIDRAGDL